MDLSAAAKGARLEVGSASFQIATGKKKTLTIRVSRRGRVLARKPLKVLAVITGIDSSGDRKTEVKRFTLR